MTILDIFELPPGIDERSMRKYGLSFDFGIKVRTLFANVAVVSSVPLAVNTASPVVMMNFAAFVALRPVAVISTFEIFGSGVLL